MITALVDYLAMFYQAGNVTQMEVIARSWLAAIPDDIVALQFLGLALYQMGYIDRAYRVFKRVAMLQDRPGKGDAPTSCETANAVSYREATRAHSGLAEGWDRIAQALAAFGFQKPASRASQAALTARGAKK